MGAMKREWSEERVRRALADLPGWRYEDGKMERVFDFPTYADGAAFAGRVFLLAERQGHHPEAVCVLDKKVGIAYAGKDGKAVTERDVEAAAMINLLYGRFIVES